MTYEERKALRNAAEEQGHRRGRARRLYGLQRCIRRAWL